jgi:hypothetical protein
LTIKTHSFLILSILIPVNIFGKLSDKGVNIVSY